MASTKKSKNGSVTETAPPAPAVKKSAVSVPTSLPSPAVMKAVSAEKTSVPITSTQMKVSSQTSPTLTYEMIAKRAYYIWEKKGRPQGQDKQNWYEAERQLKQELGIQ
ncbi:MAG: DUF2934 domain-containing protein [Thermoplasmata archaeon]